MTEYDFEAGDVFFEAGDRGDRAFLVLRGRVESVGGAAAEFGPGDIFGDLVLVDDRPRAAAARAVTAGRVREMDLAEFEQLLTADPYQYRAYLRSLLGRFRALLHPPAEVLTPAAEPVLITGPADLPAAGPAPALPGGWEVVVHPLTREAAAAVPAEGLRVGGLPFRLGRAAGAGEPEAAGLNDLWLMDDKPYTVSRNHCQIEAVRGGLVVRDRGSQLGCVVNGRRVGGRAFDRLAALRPGDNELVLGPAGSAYRFRVAVGGPVRADEPPPLPARRVAALAG